MKILPNDPAKKLFDYLVSIHRTSEGLKEDLLAAISYLSLDKGEFLLSPGDVHKNAYYIYRGLLRSFIMVKNENTKAEEESTNLFVKENDWFIHSESYDFQEPSDEYVEALEPSDLICISRNDLNALYRKHLEFNVFGNQIGIRHATEVAARTRLLFVPEASRRIEKLLQRHPDLAGRVPEKYLLTYMA